MKGQFLSKALTPGIAIGALIFAGCSTTETRISGHPEIYQSLSSRDQALLARANSRWDVAKRSVSGLGLPRPENCGQYARSPERDLDYVHYTTYYPYSDPSYGPGYGSGYGFGLTRVGFAGRHHRHGGRSFVFFGSRFYDPFFYSYIPYSVSIQGGHFRQWQGRLLPVHGTTVSLNKNSVAF